MDRYLSPVVFSADFSIAGATSPAYQIKTAEQVGFKEGWLQDAIKAQPEIVIAPCREAELTEESWHFWSREVAVPEVGSIDILLVSDSGRIGVVETKLAYNPEKRRTVLAQVLDYAVHLPEFDLEAIRDPLPSGVDRDRVEDHLRSGDFLLIIAGDRIDPRVVKLSRSLLGDNMVNEWDLALVEVAVFEAAGSVAPKYLLVPHLRGLVVPELRQVVKVVVEEGKGARVILERQSPELASASRQKWTEDRFFTELERSSLGAAMKDLARGMKKLSEKHAGTELSWGTGKTGSVTLKRNGAGLLEFYISGNIAVRPYKFETALGSVAAEEYRKGLDQLFPGAMKTDYPQMKGLQSADKVKSLVSLLDSVLTKAV